MPPPERVRRIYDAYGRSPRRRRAWSAVNPGNRAIRDELFDAITERAGPLLSAGAEVLDIGCGTGWLLERLGPDVAAGRLFGVELLAVRVSAARVRAPGATVLEADAGRLPFADGRFGLVTLLTVLSSCADRPEQDRLLAEAVRVTAPEGLLAIWEPRFVNPTNPDTRLAGGAIRALGAARTEARSLTLLPPLARRLGALTPALYPLLSAVPVLRSHRLYFVTP